jgi:hypothetical protein
MSQEFLTGQLLGAPNLRPEVDGQVFVRGFGIKCAAVRRVA